MCHSRALRREKAPAPRKVPFQAKVPHMLALCVAALQGRLSVELAQLTLPVPPRSDHLTSARGWTPTRAAQRERVVERPRLQFYSLLSISVALIRDDQF